MGEMVTHLAGLAEQRVILSFAPSTPYYELLKRIGEFFPKGSKVGFLFRNAASCQAAKSAQPYCLEWHYQYM